MQFNIFKILKTSKCYYQLRKIIEDSTSNSKNIREQKFNKFHFNKNKSKNYIFVS